MAKGASKRDAKTSYTAAIPLRQGDVEEDFEVMANDVQKYAPNLDIDLEIEVAPNKRLRPVEAVRPSARTWKISSISASIEAGALSSTSSGVRGVVSSYL